MKRINKKILENSKAVISYHKGESSYGGCQCFKDCDCAENHNPVPYEYYGVRRLNGKRKFTKHKTLKEAKERYDFVSNLD